MNFLLIGFTGPEGSGKSTAAELLRWDIGAESMGFDDPIRNDYCRARGISLSDFEIRKRRDPSCRAMLRLMGDHARGLQHDIYIQKIIRNIGIARSRGAPGVVIDDVKTIAEAEWLRSAGGVLIHVLRNALEQRDSHYIGSRVEFDDGDISIINPGTIPLLRAVLFSSIKDETGIHLDPMDYI